MNREEYFQKAKHIWKTFVPKSGQADTVQGEMLRAIEKLRDEAQRNGNMNWDEGHEILAHYIETHLCALDTFTPEQKDQIKKDIGRLYDFEKVYTNDDLYDRLNDRIVDWYEANPAGAVHKQAFGDEPVTKPEGI